MAYRRLTEDVWVLRGNYGDGDEDLTAEKTRKAIQARKREYQENDRHVRNLHIKLTRVKL